MHFTHGRHLQSLRKQEMWLAGVFIFFLNVDEILLNNGFHLLSRTTTFIRKAIIWVKFLQITINIGDLNNTIQLPHSFIDHSCDRSWWIEIAVLARLHFTLVILEYNLFLSFPDSKVSTHSFVNDPLLHLQSQQYHITSFWSIYLYHISSWHYGRESYSSLRSVGIRFIHLDNSV